MIPCRRDENLQIIPEIAAASARVILLSDEKKRVELQL
jgi:hypothetical protein